MIRIRKYISGLVTALIGVAMLAAPNQARADFAISVFINGTNTGLSAVGGDNAFQVFAATAGEFTITANSLTNWSGTPLSGLETNTSSNIVRLMAPLSGTTTVTIVISENFWTAPTGPVLLSSAFGGSIGSAGSPLTVSSTTQGFVDNSNTLATTMAPGGVSTPLASASNSLSNTGTAPLNYTPNPSTQNAPGGQPYALTEVFSFTFSASALTGDSAGASGTLTVTPSATTPAPAGIVLALTGAPVFGIGAWLRRRRQSVFAGA